MAKKKSESGMRVNVTPPQLRPGEQAVTLPLGLLVKLGSIAVHAEELISPTGHAVDRIELKTRLDDQEVRDWIGSMGPLLPMKR